MSEEKKYTIVGKVEIGTDEYRDLLEAKIEAQKESNDYLHRYWDEQSKVRKMEKKVEMMTEFLKTTKERYAEYLQFVAEKETED